jgi:DNA-3-methyladenine glycosylase
MNTYEKQILRRAFYNRNSKEIAVALLGKFVVRKLKGEVLVGMIVETEAYLSDSDEASHNFKGCNKRNQSLYKICGHAYVHSMRQWHLIDVVTEGENIPGSVLIRAVEPMRKHRHTDLIKNLTSGPSKFCQAFTINNELDGIDLTLPESPLFIADNPITVTEDSIEVSARIGISKATELLLRFSIKGNPYVSKHTKAPAPLRHPIQG